MAIINRDLDVSQQKMDYQVSLSQTAVAASAGINYVCFTAAYPCVVRAINIAAATVSGTPSLSFNTNRFIVGAGSTVLANVGATTALLAFGTSGSVGVSVPAQSSTLALLSAGDTVVMTALFSAGNVALGGFNATIVVQALQDIKSYFNVAT